MKYVVKGVFIPINVWLSHELTWMEKVALVTIDACSADMKGLHMTPAILAKELSVKQSEAKDLLNSLFKKGALEVKVNEDGENVIVALMYKDTYTYEDAAREIVGASPDKQFLNYEYIATLWNELCQKFPALQPLTRITPKRKKSTRIAMKENDISVEQLEKVFKIIQSTRFLNGTKEGDNKFYMSYDWLFSKDHLQKILDGFYCREAKERYAYDCIMSTTQLTLGDNVDGDFKEV
jgi:hypothetical protein